MSMYDISPLHLCYVAVSKLCHLLEFFPIAPLGGRVVHNSVLQQTLALISAVKYHDATVINVSTLIS